MNFKIISIILISAAVSVFAVRDILLAVEPVGPAVGEVIITEDLGVSRAGILPTSPFYFLKEWRRAISRVFAFNQSSKIRLELKILNEKAAEIQSFTDIPEKLDKAFVGYQKTIQRLHDQAENASGVLIDNFVRTLIIHQKLLDEWELKYQSPDDPAASLNLKNNKKKLSEMLAGIANRLDKPESFRVRLESIVENFPERIVLTKELRIAELISGFEDYLPPAAGTEIQKFKEELLVKFQSRIQNEEPEFLTSRFVRSLPGDYDLRLKILDEAREKTVDVSLKSRLNLLRQEVLDRFENKGIDEEKAKTTLVLAGKIIGEFNEKINSGQYLKSSSISEAAERAKFNLEQAKVFFESGNYGGAFGQASAALAAARSALNRLRTSLEDFEKDFQKLRARFDEISQKALRQPFRRPAEKEKMKNLEDLLVKLSESVRKKAGFDKVDVDFEKALKLLAELEEPVNAVVLKSPKPILKPETPKEISKNWIVEIGNSGEFSPVLLNIKKGDSVTWKNLSANLSWPASANHPDHKFYPEPGGCLGSKFDACRGLKQGESFAFTFDFIGSWHYHDHLNSSQTGLVEVGN